MTMTKQRSSSSSSSRSSSGGTPTKSDLAPFHLATVDISDRLNAMLDTECKPHYQCGDYLSHHQRPNTNSRSSRSVHSQCRSPSSSSSSRASSSSCRRTPLNRSSASAVTPASRGKIVQWLYDLVDYLDLQRECVAVAMSYVDRFVSSSSSKLESHHAKKVAEAQQDATIYQLVAISSLFLAAKQSDKMAIIDANVLVCVSHGSYSAQEIMDMESIIVEVLDWRLCCPTSIGIAYHAIALLAKVIARRRSCSIISSVVDFCRLQIELSIMDYETSVLRSPSTVALAAIVNSMELLDFEPQEKRAFGKVLMRRTGVDIRYNTNSIIAQTSLDLHQIFDRQSKDVMRKGDVVKQEKKMNDPDANCPSVSSSRSPIDVEGLTNFDNSTKHHRPSSSSTNNTTTSSSRRKHRRQYPSPMTTSNFERRTPLEP